MHSYLGTQFSQELRYYGLHAVAVCTKVNQCVEGGWCKQGYTKQRLTPIPSGRTRWRGQLDDRGSEHQGHNPIIIKRTQSNHTRPEDGWQGRMAMERRACGIALFG